MTPPLPEQSPSLSPAANKPANTQSDKEKRLSDALRKNLLRRKAGNSHYEADK